MHCGVCQVQLLPKAGHSLFKYLLVLLALMVGHECGYWNVIIIIVTIKLQFD